MPAQLAVKDKASAQEASSVISVTEQKMEPNDAEHERAARPGLNMARRYLMADLSSLSPEPLKLAYIDQPTIKNTECKGVVLLIHGFPQTSHQFRLALPLLSAKGYRCIVPDYRGAGASSKDLNDFRKSTMAADMVALLDYLGLKQPVDVVGHDIGGMIAYSLAARFPKRVRSVIWGECPLPGTNEYVKAKTEDAVQYFHFIFQSVPNLPEALVAGRERIYVQHFLQKITYDMAAFTDEDIDFYAQTYAQPGAMRCAFGVYRAFEEDAKDNVEWVKAHGKCKVPTMVLNGKESGHRHGAAQMAGEVTEEDVVEVGEVEGAAHYLAEENAKGFVDVVAEYLERQA